MLIVSGEKNYNAEGLEIISDKINDDNKKQLVQVLLNSWNSDASAELLRGLTVTLICEGEGFEQTSYGESTFCSAVSSLRSTQEETDSRVVFCFSGGSCPTVEHSAAERHVSIVNVCLQTMFEDPSLQSSFP